MERNKKTNGSQMFAAERRSRIYEHALRSGSVSVAELAESMGVVENTIRRDLDVLHEEGKLVRSHGGAVIKEHGMSVPHYSQTRNTHMEEKSWIGLAAVKHLPASGLVFINSGTTTYQMALRIPEDTRLQIVTTALDIAAYLANRPGLDVHILGGKINPDSLSSTCSMAVETLDKFYWDVSFIGPQAVDLVHGITSSYMDAAHDTKIIEHSRKTVLLCDSSKFGRVSNFAVSPLSTIDVLISDTGLNPEIVDELTKLGINVELVGPTGIKTR